MNVLHIEISDVWGSCYIEMKRDNLLFQQVCTNIFQCISFNELCKLLGTYKIVKIFYKKLYVPTYILIDT